MVKDREEKLSGNRRDFLKLASVGSAAGVVSIATGAAANTAPEAGDRNSGYRETDHVRAFYSLARF